MRNNKSSQAIDPTLNRQDNDDDVSGNNAVICCSESFVVCASKQPIIQPHLAPHRAAEARVHDEH